MNATIPYSVNNERKLLFKLLSQLRVHHWVKNLLVYIVPLTAHLTSGYGKVTLGFICFCFLASATYIFNDIVDLESDRRHRWKRHRPLAGGQFNRSFAVVLATVLAIGSLTGAAYIGRDFLSILFVYVFLNLSYTFLLKRMLVLDVMCLAAFYALRTYAGGTIAGITPSAWFIAFCLFLFLCLAFLKRYIDLLDNKAASEEFAPSRHGFIKDDQLLIQTTGVVCGLCSVLVLCLYINSTEISAMYSSQEIIWFVIPLFLYWIIRVWFLADRGDVHNDVIVFAVKDPVSYIVAVLITVFVVLAI